MGIHDLQIATAAVDATGMCLFVVFAALDQPDTFQALIDMINAFYGLKLTADDVNSAIVEHGSTLALSAAMPGRPYGGEDTMLPCAARFPTEKLLTPNPSRRVWYS